jgi:hypothetical protein
MEHISWAGETVVRHMGTKKMGNLKGNLGYQPEILEPRPDCDPTQEP